MKVAERTLKSMETQYAKAKADEIRLKKELEQEINKVDIFTRSKEKREEFNQVKKVGFIFIFFLFIWSSWVGYLEGFYARFGQRGWEDW